MALEKGNLNIEKLKAKLQERYPNYDFDKPAPLDRRCKVVEEVRTCTKIDERPLIIDNNGNEVCVYLFKQQVDNSIYGVEKRCHAVVTTKEERKHNGREQQEIPF